MKIGFDLSPALISRAGIGHYTKELAVNLDKIDSINCTFFVNDISLASEFKLKNIIEIKNAKPNLKWMFKVSKYFRKNNFDWFVSTSNFAFAALIPSTVQVVHDIAPISHPKLYTLKQRFVFIVTLLIASIRAKKLGVISNSTKLKLEKKFPWSSKKTFFLGTGIQSSIDTFVKDSKKVKLIREKYKLPAKYILSVSTHFPRKNYALMLKSFSKFTKLDNETHYVIVGKETEHTLELKSLVKKLKIENKVHFLGYVPEEEIAYIYDFSSFLMYLSQEEGFGVPPVEAYMRKRISLLSDIDVFKEIMEDNAIYTDLKDTNKIAEKMFEISKMTFDFDIKFFDKYKWNQIVQRLIQELGSK